MDHVLTIAEERLNLFAHMANSACGLSLWCFGMKKQLYTCTCPAEKEFRLFLDLGQCLDYAIAHGPESHVPILMSDPIFSSPKVRLRSILVFPFGMGCPNSFSKSASETCSTSPL